jgi:hypothetical protein
MKTSWEPVSRTVLALGVLTAFAFWIQALTDNYGFLLLDFINLPFHEFGHLFFGIFGETVGIWGGTIMQLLIPLGLFINFFLRKDTAGVAFCSFWFGENLLNIASYVGDARTMALPLVGGGEHDWNIILMDLDMLKYDTTIAGIVRTFGWLIMVSAVVWFVIIGLKQPEE